MENEEGEDRNLDGNEDPVLDYINDNLKTLKLGYSSLLGINNLIELEEVLEADWQGFYNYCKGEYLNLV